MDPLSLLPAACQREALEADPRRILGKVDPATS